MRRDDQSLVARTKSELCPSFVKITYVYTMRRLDSYVFPGNLIIPNDLNLKQLRDVLRSVQEINYRCLQRDRKHDKLAQDSRGHCHCLGINLAVTIHNLSRPKKLENRNPVTSNLRMHRSITMRQYAGIDVQEECLLCLGSKKKAILMHDYRKHRNVNERASSLCPVH